jgi:hypothetical protein
MLKRLVLLSRLYFAGAMLVAVPVIAQAPAPSQEFWDYLAEYGDDNGDVIDPLEYDEILSMKDTEDMTIKEKPLAREESPVDQPHIRNADMKFEQKSSAQASSSAMKGAKL